jgi:hypothetical protein
MEKYESVIKRPVNRRSLLKSGMLAGGAAVVGAGTGLFSGGKSAFAQDSGGSLTKGDVFWRARPGRQNQVSSALRSTAGDPSPRLKSRQVRDPTEIHLHLRSHGPTDSLITAAEASFCKSFMRTFVVEYQAVAIRTISAGRPSKLE